MGLNPLTDPVYVGPMYVDPRHQRVVTAKKTASQNSTLTSVVGAAEGALPGLGPAVDAVNAVTNNALARPVANTAKNIGDDVSSAANDAASVGSFLGKLGKASTWLTVLEAVAGAILIIMGLRQLASVAGVEVGPSASTLTKWAIR